MKSVLTWILVFAMLAPIAAFTEITDVSQGTKESPYYASKGESGTISFNGIDPSTYESVTADISIKIIGKYNLGDAINKIEELTYLSLRGPFIECYKVLVKASNLTGGKLIEVSADNFKLYDHNAIQADILTILESAELLNDTGAYLYIGVNTKNAYAMHIVFDNTLWFEIFDAEVIDE